MKILFLKYWPLLILAAVTLLLFITNYIPGTYLSGWDNLLPELNFPLNFKRSLFAVWQEYQGLGLLGGMGHASDLPHILFLWISSLIIPNQLLRYFYHFLMVFIGIVGVYYIMKHIFLSEFPKSIQIQASLLASLFYLLNLGTIQYFYVPFEPYSTFWAFFPWELYTVLRYLHNPSKRNLIFLILIHLCALPQGYVQTIFLVYSICIGIILGIHAVLNRSKKTMLLCIKIALIIFTLNAFWLLPNFYFVVKNLSVTQNAMQNQMATEKFFQMNKHRGTVLDFPVLKEFYYDFFDYDQNSNKFDYLMKPWRDHFSSPFITLIGYGFFLLLVYGIFKKSTYRFILIGLFMLSCLIFLSDTFIISSLNDMFRSFPLINQIFRNPFTKFIVPAIFVFSAGFGLGAAYLIQKVSSSFSTVKAFLVTLFLIILLGVYALPVFQGHFIDTSMKVKIPQEYFQLFSYLSTQDPNARIMNLPQGSFWGWYYYRFGMRGSGFLWYGIEQPIMDRAFDVWSSDLENYYWQLSYALKKRDQTLFNTVIDKYQISYVLYDNNLVFTDGLSSPTTVYNQQDLLKNSTRLTLKKQFGHISLYQVKSQYAQNSKAFATTKLPAVYTNEQFSQKDVAFNTLGNYYSQKDKPYTFVFPFESLFSSRFQNENAFQVTQNPDSFILKTTLPKGNYTLTLPSFTDSETSIPTQVFAKKQGTTITIRFQTLMPSITIGNTSIQSASNIKDIEIAFPVIPPNGLIVDINNKDYLQIQNLSDSFSPIGSVYLSHVIDGNYMRIYTATAQKTQLLPASDFYAAQECGIALGNQSFSFTQKNSITLSAKNVAICSAYKEQLSGFEKSLLSVSLDYTSSSDEFPQYCVYSQYLHSCLNRKDVITHGFSKTIQHITDYFESSDKQNDQMFFNAILEATADESKDKQKTIQYKNIVLSSYQYLTGGVIDITTLRDTTQSIPVTTSTNTPLSIEITKIDSLYSLVNPIQKHIYKTDPLNYDTFLLGSYSLTTLPDSSIRLSATNSSSYFLIRGYNLSAGNGYLTCLESRNKNSFPFIVNAFTQEDFRNYVYTYSQKNSDFSSNCYVFAPLYEFDQGIDILLASSSYSSVPTINDIKDVTMYPLPYQYITGISLKTQNSSYKNSQIIPVEIQKQNISLYTATLKNSVNVPYFLILPQSYDTGWHVYKTNSINPFSLAFPFIFTQELHSHVKVNNWENGWILDSSSQKGTYIIVYLPQYLEYTGFIILLGIFAWLGRLFLPLFYRTFIKK